MILTKKEFAEHFGYKNERSLFTVIKNGSLVLNSDGLIDTTENEEFCEQRKELLKKRDKKKAKEKEKKEKPEKDSHQLSLQIDELNAKLDERRLRGELLKLKIAKDKGSVVEASVLNNVIKMAFEDMMKTLVEFPNIYANDIINLIRAEEEPKEILVEFLTDKVTEAIKMGLANAKQAAKKYYKG